MKCPSCSADLYSDTVSCPRCGIYLRGYVANLPNPRKEAPKTPPPKTATPRKWRIGGIIVGLLTLFLEIFFRQAMWTGYLIYQQHSAVEASPGYRLGLLTAKSSPQLQQALGQPIDTSGFALGELRRARGTDFTEWWVRLKGPKGSGYLYGVANHIGNTWDYSRLAFIPSGGQPRINLTAPPQQEHRRLADAVRQVYLVPLDAASASAIAWAHAYYKTRLGIDVNILPAISLPVSVINPQRRQIAAEKALDAMRQAEGDLARDPSTIMIGVTSQDMYLNEFDWDYSVNLRQRRFAIISTARLEPFSDLGEWQRRVLRLLLMEKWNTELPGARLQKLLSKNVLVECFDLPLSNDYTSVVNFGSQTWWDVDWMGNEIIGAPDAGSRMWKPAILN
jgi:predicted Zn-dependent protease